MQRSRSRNRFGGKTQFEILRDAAQAAALANGASLWYAGREQDLTGFVFEDSAGTTPATGTDPIGLLLDRAYGAANLGPELASNTGSPFVATTGYTGVRSTLSLSSGNLVVTGTSTFPGVYFTFATTSGKTYTATVNVNSLSLAPLRIVAKNGTTDAAPDIISGDFTSAGVCRITFTAAGANSTIFALIQQASIQSFSVSSISVREVLGIPALQATAANKPTLELQASGYYGMRFDGTSDVLSTLFQIGGNVDFSLIVAGSTSASGALSIAAGVYNGSVNLRAYLSANATTRLLGGGAGSVQQGISPFFLSGQSWLTSRVGSVTKNATRAQLYADGVLAVDEAQTSTSSPLPMTIGSGYNGAAAAPALFFPGLIHLVCASTTAMSTADRIAIERFAALLSGAAYV